MIPIDEPLRLLVHRQDLRNTCLTADPDAYRPLAPGQARLRIDRFALTSNNITCAAFGDVLKYWEFFPADRAGHGCVPVWGFATVVESRADGPAIGRRCYGYLPMGSHLVVEAGASDARGFVDRSGHRARLPAIYNRLVFCDADPAYEVANEARQALLRPLFVTAFLIDDFLAEHDFFGAAQVLISSASSKTAYGTALCVSARRHDAGVTVAGLTSQAHLDFTRSLGCYDRVLAYDALQTLDPSRPTVYVDLSGNAQQRAAVHRHFGGALSYSCAVGGTHWDRLGRDSELPGPRPTLFLAPSQLRRRLAPPPAGWGPARLQERVDAAWARLMRAMDRAGSSPWLVVDAANGATAVRQAYLDLLEGRSDPRAGRILSFHAEVPQAPSSVGR